MSQVLPRPTPPHRYSPRSHSWERHSLSQRRGRSPHLERVGRQRRTGERRGAVGRSAQDDAVLLEELAELHCRNLSQELMIVVREYIERHRKELKGK